MASPYWIDPYICPMRDAEEKPMTMALAVFTAMLVAISIIA